MRLIGIVKHWRPDKGFGFLRHSTGKDYFVHVSSVAGERDLERGEQVKFTPSEDDQGRLRAVEVVPEVNKTEAETALGWLPTSGGG